MDNYTIYPKRLIKALLLTSLGLIVFFILLTLLVNILSNPADMTGNIRNIISFFAESSTLLTLLLLVSPLLLLAVLTMLKSTVYLDQDGVHLLNYFRCQTILYQEIKIINARFIFDTRSAPEQVMEIGAEDRYFQLRMASYSETDITCLFQSLRLSAPKAQFNDVAKDLTESDWEEYRQHRREEVLKLFKASAVFVIIMLIIAGSVLTARHYLIERDIGNYLENQQTKTYSREKIAGLENQAAEIGKHNNVAVARKVNVLFQLGDAYSSEMNFAGAMDTVK